MFRPEQHQVVPLGSPVLRPFTDRLCTAHVGADASSARRSEAPQSVAPAACPERAIGESKGPAGYPEGAPPSAKRIPL